MFRRGSEEGECMLSMRLGLERCDFDGYCFTGVDATA